VRAGQRLGQFARHYQPKLAGFRGSPYRPTDD
jgi:hypothetical protein